MLELWTTIEKLFQEKRAITGPIVKSTKANLIIAQEQYNIGKISIILWKFKIYPWHLCKHLLNFFFEKKKKIHFSWIILCWGKGNKKEINKSFPRELDSLSKQTCSCVSGPWLKFKNQVFLQTHYAQIMRKAWRKWLYYGRNNK